MEHRPIQKPSESIPKWETSPETMIETIEVVPDIGASYTIEVVPDIGACYTIEVVPDVGACCTIDELGNYVLYSGSDIASDEDSDRTSTDSDISGYDGDHDIEQGEVSGNATDSDVESRIALAKKAKIVLQKASGMDSISGMPLESLFEEIYDGLDTEGCLGNRYSDEFLSGNEDLRLATLNGHFVVMDQPNDKENVAPKDFSVGVLKNCRSVKRKLSCDD